MMDLQRFTGLCDAYGADSGRWPEAERTEAMAFAQTSPAAAQVLSAAEALDATLDMSRPASPSQGLRQRVLASAPAPRPTMRSRLDWGFRAGLGAGLAAAGLAGVLVGSTLTAPEREPASAAAIAALDASPEVTAFGPVLEAEG
jgi:hypothetical protein